MSSANVFAKSDAAKTYSPLDALDEDGKVWSFYIIPVDKMEMDITPTNMVVTANGTTQAMSSGMYVRWTAQEKAQGKFFVHPDSPSKIGIRFTVPHDGNYKFHIELKNTSVNNRPLNTGTYSLGVLDPDSEWNVSSFSQGSFQQTPDNAIPAVISGNAALKEGQSLMLWLTGQGAGGYETKYLIEETDEKGVEYRDNGLEGLLPQSIPNGVTPAPYRENLLWIGAPPTGEDPQRIKDVYSLWSKYFPNRVAVVMGGNLDPFGAYEFYSEHNVPVLRQYSVGTGLSTYWNKNGATELLWDEKSTHYQITQHDGAIPHEAYKKSFDQGIRTGAAVGATGYGHSDYCWNWALGYGVGGNVGYNPQTVEAFRKALQGQDEGLRITLNGGPAQTLHFWDYAKHYIGRELTPQEMGFSSWEEYKPLTKKQFVRDMDKDYTPRYILHDLLVHYEYLLGAQFFGSVSSDELGGITQILPNNEDQANGNDMLFLGGIENVTMVTEEYFNDSFYLDGAYYHFPALTRNAGKDKSVGVVLEGGVSGNAHTYYDIGTAYACSYEISSVGWSSHMELDWWHAQFSWPVLLNNPRYSEHLQTLMSFGRGYVDAQEDHAERISPEFISISSRSMMRPWAIDFLQDGLAFRQFTWRLGCNTDPEYVLAKKGYVFEGIGEDSVYEYLNEPRKIISYAPDMTMRYHFDGVMEKIKSGMIENTIIPAVGLRSIVDTDLHLKDMARVYPEFAGVAETGSLHGKLTAPDGSTLAENIDIDDTELYAMKDGRWKPAFMVGETPVVMETDYGKGKIWLTLFNPREPVNYELTGAVYTYLLEQNGISRHWLTVENSGTLTGNNKIKEDGEYVKYGALESEASVRLYKNEAGMTIAGVQNSLGRFFAANNQRQQGNNIPYEFDGVTCVKVLVDEPNTAYDYVAMPSGIRGSGQSDAQGYLELRFYDTTHEIFYILPASAESVSKLSGILQRKQNLNDAVSLDGRISREDTSAPVTTPSVDGVKAADGSYGGKAVLTLSVTDNGLGSGVKKVEYSINDGKPVTVTNHAALRSVFTYKISLQKGENIVRFKATDKAGNEEPEGVITIVN